MQEKLKQIIEKKSVSKADKDFLTPLLQENGIELPTKTSCASCWRDAAIMLLRKVKGDDVQSDESRAYRLIKGDSGTNGCIFKGRFLSNDVMTEELYQWAVANGFPERLWQ